MKMKTAKKVREVSCEFLENTSAHGLPNAHRATSVPRKVIWSLIFLGSLAGFTTQSYLLLDAFFKYPHNVDIRREFGKKVTFPAVTICNLNPIRLNKIREKLESGNVSSIVTSLTDSRWPEQLVPEEFVQEAQGILSQMDEIQEDLLSPPPPLRRKRSLLSHLGSRSNGSASSPSSSSTLSSPSSSISTSPSQTTDTLYTTESSNSNSLSQYWDAREGTGNYFKDKPNDMKTSELFEQLYSKMDDQDRAYFGHDLKHMLVSCTYGLSLQLDVEQEQYLGGLSNEAGVRVLVHSQGNIAFPEDEGFTVSPGFATSVGLKLVSTSRLTHPYISNCTNGLTTLYRNVTEENQYSVQACVKSCQQYRIMEICSCAAAFLAFPAKNISICDLANNKTKEECVRNIMNSEDTCICPQACNDTSYEMTISSSTWPSEQYYSQNMVSKLSTKDGRYSTMEKTAMTQNLLKLDIYFQQLNYELVQEVPAITTETLIGSIGGLAGFYIGVSCCTVCEFFELIFGICACLVAKICNRQLTVQDSNRSESRETLRMRHTTSPVTPLNKQKMAVSSSSLHLDIPERDDPWFMGYHQGNLPKRAVYQRATADSW
ncbi:acid-sensing ion channel 4-like [Lingula anatina]|uniref:Acid-sensing ion channel 4-like n=1 Tax=Lingula anatina TaxID=7574 RepID=A0A1S3JPS6_LINAN|nr:acid-sensing ion channel 4-like [Lingula anatina]|eukprot:XP_013411979.1 acid-sensing ion channel 4-like [Lingula anatina]